MKHFCGITLRKSDAIDKRAATELPRIDAMARVEFILASLICYVLCGYEKKTNEATKADSACLVSSFTEFHDENQYP